MARRSNLDWRTVHCRSCGCSFTVIAGKPAHIDRTCLWCFLRPERSKRGRSFVALM